MINVAIIGCGYWGSNLIRVFAQLEQCHIHTCCDSEKSKLEKVKSIYPYINITSNYQDVLNNSEIDAIILATPVYSHFNMAKLALLANKHVLVEKPMTSLSKESKELIELANQKNKILMVDHTFEFEPAIRQIKKIIELGDIGDIYYINASWLNLGLLRPDVNVVFDLATHIFSIINYITNKQPISVKASGNTYVSNNNLEEMANLIVKYPDKLIANINVSWLEPYKTRKMVIVGSKKMLVFDLLQPQEQLKVFDKGVDINNTENKISYRSGDVFSPNVQPVEPLKEMAKHFLSCIVESKKPLTSGENGLTVAKLLEAAEQSLKNNGIEIELNKNTSCEVIFGKDLKVFQPQLTNLYGCEIGDNTKIGAFVEVQKNAKIGKNCKISTHSFICEGVVIEDDVFIGHGVKFINDKYPRATLNGVLQSEKDWKVVPTIVKKGASIGTNSTILCGITIGENSIIGAGSVVTKNIPPNSIAYGNPAKIKSPTTHDENSISGFESAI